MSVADITRYPLTWPAGRGRHAYRLYTADGHIP